MAMISLESQKKKVNYISQFFFVKTIPLKYSLN